MKNCYGLWVSGHFKYPETKLSSFITLPLQGKVISMTVGKEWSLKILGINLAKQLKLRFKLTKK